MEAEKPEVKEMELDQEPVIEDEKNPSAETEIDGQGDDTKEELAVVFGDEEPEEKKEEESPVLNTVRKQLREAQKRLKELEKSKQEETKIDELGPKPTLENCDMDDKLFEQRLIEYHEKSKLIEEQKKKAKEEWQQRVENYATRKKEFSQRVRDYDEKESIVEESLTPTQIGIILDVCDKSDEMIYALGANTKKLQELAKITNPIRFSSAIGKLENNMKTISRKPQTQPEKTLKGDKPMSSQVDKKLDQLREAAAKGDPKAMSDLVAYKRQLKRSG